MLVLNLPFKALMFLTLMRPSLVLFLVLWLKLVKDFLKVRCRLALRSEERFSRNAETDLVCRLLLEKKNKKQPGRCPVRREHLPGGDRTALVHAALIPEAPPAGARHV